MLTIQKLKLKNWCQHKELDMMFGNTTTGIIGKNGAGKSNTISALHFALTGTPLTNSSNEGCINFDADAAEITLHFSISNTPCYVIRTLTANRTQDGLREPCKSAAKLVIDGKETISGVKAVQTKINDILGVSKAVLSEHVFISQDTLNSLLFSTPAERLNGLIMLMPEIAKAEWLRNEIAKELLSFPDLVVAVSIPELKHRRDALVDTIHKTQETFNTKQASLDSLASVFKDTTDKIYKHKEALQAKIKHDQATNELNTLVADDMEVRRQQLTEELGALENELESLKSDADNSSTLLDKHTKASLVYERYTELYRLKNQCELDSSSLIKPVEPKSKLSLNTPDTITNAKVEIATIKAWLDAYDSGNGLCPTCQAPMASTVEAVEDKRSRYKILTDSLAVLENAWLSYQNNIKEYYKLKDQYENKLKYYEDKLADIQQEMVTLEVSNFKADILTSDVLAKYTDSKVNFESCRQRIVALSAELSKIQSNLSTITTKRLAIQAHIAQLNEQLAFELSDEAYHEAQQLLQTHDKLKTEVITLNVTVGNLNSELLKLNADIAATEATQRQVEGRRKYRHYLESARNILHRDQLPTKLVAQKTTSLCSSCNRFLELFGTPFVLKISSEMQMACILPSGHEIAINMLSGGQRSVLSVCMRFAINELFGTNLGLLILDEPSASMDRDNVIAMRGLFDQIHSVSITTGVQTIIITHHAELLGAFDGLIEL